MKLRRHWKWVVVIAAAVAGFAVLFLLTPASPTSVTFSAVMPVVGNATDIPFELKSSRMFRINGHSNFVEAITAEGTTNYEFIGSIDKYGRLPSSVNSHSSRMVINVTVPEGTKQFHAKKGYWELSTVAKGRLYFNRRFPGVGKYTFVISRPFEKDAKYREVWSPWIVKTNGMWVERAER